VKPARGKIPSITQLRDHVQKNFSTSIFLAIKKELAAVPQRFDTDPSPALFFSGF
jgi:hypothetical protein